MSNKTYYYVSGSTAKGPVNYLQSNIEHIKQLFILNHPSHSVKTEILNGICSSYEAHDDIEIICSPLGKEFLEGIIIREQSLAIVTDSIALDKYPNATEIDLSKHVKFDEINGYDIQGEIDLIMTSAYENFSKGLKIHDQLEQIYIEEMDFNKADAIADSFIYTLLKTISKKAQESHTYYRLFGTNTKDGVVNVVPNLINDIRSRYYIKGRAGTGKSVFMNKVAEACRNHGFDIELYHCSFDPKSIDMVRVPEMDICLFDSTDPHEFIPEHDDFVIDLYEETVTAGTDEKHAAEINKVTKEYKAYMKKGINNIKVANIYHKQLEQAYKGNISKASIEKAIHHIYREIDA